MGKEEKKNGENVVYISIGDMVKGERGEALVFIVIGIVLIVLAIELPHLVPLVSKLLHQLGSLA